MTVDLSAAHPQFPLFIFLPHFSDHVYQILSFCWLVQIQRHFPRLPTALNNCSDRWSGGENWKYNRRDSVGVASYDLGSRAVAHALAVVGEMLWTWPTTI